MSISKIATVPENMIKYKSFPKLENKFILAPMAGINDVAFRILCRRYGAALAYTEMVSANALVRNNKATLQLLEYDKKEKPVTVQLFGQNTDHLVEAAKIIENNFDYDCIDINFGCPARKIFNEGAGCALMNRPAKIGEIIKAVSAAVNIPVTAKIRAGISAKKINGLEIAKIIEDNGASAIAVHARMAIQGYAGKADWKYITQVKENVKIPVIGNGDAISPESAQKMMQDTGCDYVMIGRAARGNPFIFKQCNDFLKTGKYENYSSDDRKKAFIEYLELAKEHNVPFAYMKIHGNYFTKSMVKGAILRDRISKTKNIGELKELFHF